VFARDLYCAIDASVAAAIRKSHSLGVASSRLVFLGDGRLQKTDVAY